MNDLVRIRASCTWTATNRRKADIQKRRPKRPPKLNGGALLLGRIGAHTAAKNARHRNQYSVTELRVTDALAQHTITLARVLTRILHRPPPPLGSLTITPLFTLTAPSAEFPPLMKHQRRIQYPRCVCPAPLRHSRPHPLTHTHTHTTNPTTQE